MSTTLTPPRHVDEPPMRARPGVSPIRLASAIVLTAWGSLFWFLLLTGRTQLYLSTRTSWVVPIGAALLTMAAIGRLLSLRADEPEPLHLREAWILGVMVLPVVAILVLPPATLGAYAVGGRSLLSSGATASAGDVSSGSLTLVDVAGAQTNKEASKALSARAGDTATFVGFVTDIPGNPPGEFLLTRYYITCCIADAQTIEVHIVDAPTGKFQQDDWVKVTGKIYPLGRTVLMDAAVPGSVVGIPKPSHPYITA
ncbi:MAG: TIGR03943 family protein [Actinomycetota bacterium]|nr:TIGR03943 family protein [Actinomycetota bacterium]